MLRLVHTKILKPDKSDITPTITYYCNSQKANPYWFGTGLLAAHK